MFAGKTTEPGLQTGACEPAIETPASLHVSARAVFGVTQFSALATIRNPSVHWVAAASGSAGVFAPFAVSNR